MKTLTPAFGRDYKTEAEVLHAYTSGADFILNDITSQWDGKPCSCRDFPAEPVKLRYSNLRKVTICTWHPPGELL